MLLLQNTRSAVFEVQTYDDFKQVHSLFSAPWSSLSASTDLPWNSIDTLSALRLVRSAGFNLDKDPNTVIAIFRKCPLGTTQIVFGELSEIVHANASQLNILGSIETITNFRINDSNKIIELVTSPAELSYRIQSTNEYIQYPHPYLEVLKESIQEHALTPYAILFRQFQAMKRNGTEFTQDIEFKYFYSFYRISEKNIRLASIYDPTQYKKELTSASSLGLHKQPRTKVCNTDTLVDENADETDSLPKKRFRYQLSELQEISHTISQSQANFLYGTPVLRIYGELSIANELVNLRLQIPISNDISEYEIRYSYPKSPFPFFRIRGAEAYDAFKKMGIEKILDLQVN